MASPHAPSPLHGRLLGAGWLLSSLLLGKATYDLSRLDPIVAAVSVSCFVGFLLVSLLNVCAAWTGRHATRPVGPRAHAALTLAIPVAMLASIFDCMGLAFDGCSLPCTILIRGVVPVIAALALLFLVTRRAALLTAMSAAGLVLLVPNCTCYNPVNRSWIDWIGYSPACFAASFGVGVLALSTLRTGRLVHLSAAFAWLTIAAILAFFVGHHYYDWPW